MIRGWNNLPDNNKLELTRAELFESTDLDNGQKVALSQVLTFAELLGVKVWFFPEVPCISFEFNGNFSDVLSITTVDAINNLVFTLELFCGAQGIDPTEQKENGNSINLLGLAKRVSALEQKIKSLTEFTPNQNGLIQDDILVSEIDSENAVDFDGLALEPRLRLFVAQLRTRARFIGCDIVCEDKLPELMTIKGSDPNKQFNYVYTRPTKVYSPVHGRMERLSVGRVYKPRWPHWYKSAAQVSGWLFHLPEDFATLEKFVLTDEYHCGVKRTKV